MSAKYRTMVELLEMFPNNPTILEAVIKTEDHINTVARDGGRIMVSISGGSDSDIVLDMFERLGYDEGEVVYVWFDTGLEYEATKQHLKYLEEKYGIEIHRYRPKMTVAQACKKFGIPFFSKEVSEKVNRLQRKGFGFTDMSYSEMMATFDRIHSAAKWWSAPSEERDRFSVDRNYGMREFMISTPPPFKISDQCCEQAKKRTARKVVKQLGATITVTGVRRAEGGIRAFAYTSCFSEATSTSVAQFRPLFYFSDADKAEYKEFCGVTYSDCYEVWGFKRTGCVLPVWLWIRKRT